MNKDRILQLADRIENLPDPEAFDMARFHHECGAPACFAGFAIDTFIPGIDMTLASGGTLQERAAEVLDLSANDAYRLFRPFGFVCNPYTISNRQGAKVLRHLAETGEINFDVGA